MTTFTLHDIECLPFVQAAKGRLLAKIKKNPLTDCWEWTGKRDLAGYGTICVLPISKYAKAHRVAWVLTHGPIPKENFVIRHQCDNRCCVNPAHLVNGTQTDNCRDAFERQRSKGGAWERHRKAKLTREQVASIRASRKAGETCASLGREYGVGRDQISRICTGKVWRPSSIRPLDPESAG
ncbi:MAG: HNH endonuclease [Gammaproteobacteria bacterium]|jgi:hypothetical protein|nr:HNH endonuclease [Gammaproteobacteria bacterium]